MASNAFTNVPAWPSETTPAHGGPGHNRPPIADEVRAQFREHLLSERPAFLTRIDEIEASATRVEVTDDVTLGRAGDLIKIIRASINHIADAHKLTKAPYLEAGRTVDAEKNELTQRLEAARRKAEAPMNAYVAQKEAERRAEQARLAAEQRRQAEEAAKRQAEIDAAAEAGDEEALANLAPIAEAAAPAAPEPVRSETGTTTSGRTTWESQVTDYEVAFMQVSDNEKVCEAIDKAIAGLVRGGARKIEGVRIWPVTKAVSR